MRKVGFVGWRGMVGSVLMERMRAEKDFKGFEPVFFSTSQSGQKAPDVGMGGSLLEDALSVEKLSSMEIVESPSLFLAGMGGSRIPVVVAPTTWAFAAGVTLSAALATSLLARRWLARLDSDGRSEWLAADDPALSGDLLIAEQRIELADGVKVTPGK